ncbi:MAG TPA: DUF1707 domain-containing protein [Microbacteriaceae bacterium]
MIDFSDPATHNLRLSNAERDEAVAALDKFAAEGRLTATESAERSAAVRAAITRGELAPLFDDLPASTIRPSAAHAADAGPSPAYAAAPAASEAFAGAVEREHTTQHWQYAIAAISPFLAVALFFITGTLWGYGVAWLWFLLIPVVGITVYGAGGWGDHEHGRERNRKRNR